MILALQKKYINEPIQTIYFGGGTPSLLKNDLFDKIVHQIHNIFTVAPVIEFTIEANPDDISEEKLFFWKQMGVNRLSIGVQSFQQQALEWMNRAHNAQQALESIQLAKQYGFDNISIDLIYGTPTLSMQHLLDDLQIIACLQISHVSCYALTIEEKTALYHFIKENKMENVDAHIQEAHFNLIVEKLNSLGYIHYEISNFAKPNMQSQHNSNYWNGIHYIGIGPSAHSYNTVSRQWNVANNALYIQSLENDIIPYEIEKLTTDNQYNEFIMVGLRKLEGINLEVLDKKFGSKYLSHTFQILEAKKELLEIKNKNVSIKKECRFLADGIAADFFII